MTKKEVMMVENGLKMQENPGGDYLIEAVQLLANKKIKILDIQLQKDVYAPIAKKYHKTVKSVKSQMIRSIGILRNNKKIKEIFDNCSKLSVRNYIINMVKYYELK